VSQEENKMKKNTMEKLQVRRGKRWRENIRKQSYYSHDIFIPVFY
jgi:hypothetical protein